VDRVRRAELTELKRLLDRAPTAKLGLVVIGAPATEGVDEIATAGFAIPGTARRESSAFLGLPHDGSAGRRLE
jgi:hypothetical protein